MNELTFKEIRKKLNLKQQEVANLLQISVRTVQNYEYQNKEVPSTIMSKFRDLYAKKIQGVQDGSFLKKKLDTDLILEKDGVVLRDFEIVDWFVKNEEVLLEKSDYFRLWLSEKIKNGVHDELQRLGFKVTYTKGSS